MKRAACHGKLPASPGDPDIFFPANRAEEAEAVGSYCLGCPVKDECDAWAEEMKTQHGIWGGRKRKK